jgi:hypothetical protein
MNTADQFKFFLSNFVMTLPTLVISLVAGVVILIKWREASSGSLWALLGFGLAVILCFVMPIGQTLLHHWVFQNAEVQRRMWAITTFNFTGSILRGVVYLFLLIAIFAGRRKTETAIPPSLGRP